MICSVMNYSVLLANHDTIQIIIIFNEQIFEDQKNVLEIRFCLIQEKLSHMAKEQNQQKQTKVEASSC